jgi:transaldolase
VKEKAMSTTSVSVENPLKQLYRMGQSVWLDYIRRDLITSGELKQMIERDGLAGMTSNPAIFEKAIAGGKEYSDFIAELKNTGLDAKTVYEHLAVRDIQDAADALRSVYDSTNKRDGYVSLEVSPHLAYKTEETIEEARRLWKAVDRPNLMIKVPGTSAGLPAVETLLAEGINVNITLLFSQQVYEDVARTYISALQKRADLGLDIASIASVASFFVSRIDTSVDSLIDAQIAAGVSDPERMVLEFVRSKTAIANAKLAYESYRHLFAGPSWEVLAARGAQTQRVLWASTSTKNPKLRDVLYVEELIGKDTVNTIPPATYDAFREHGEVRESLEENLEDARKVMNNLVKVGISLKQVTDDLTTQGVKLFEEAFDKLLAAVAK